MSINPIPRWLAQVDYITNVIKNPCGARPSVYVEAIGPALAQLWAVLIAPQPDDVVRGMLRPRNAGLRTARHIRGGGRRGEGGIPDVGSAAGKWLRDAAGIKPMVPTGIVGGIANSFVAVWDAYELTGLALLLVGGSLDAGSLYTSLILDMSCGPDPSGTGPQRFKDRLTVLALLGWHSTTTEPVYAPPPDLGWVSQPAVLGNRKGGCIVVMNARAFNPGARPRRIRFGFWTGDITVPPQVQGSYVIVPPFGEASVGLATWLPSAGTAINAMEAPDGNVTLIGLDFWASDDR